jgi:NitT/TauT family transport system substrate-binding protein
MNVPRLFKRPLVLAVAALALGVSACSSGSASSGAAGGGTSSNSASGKPELSTITIGALPSADSVTLQIAMDKGFFKQQGLNVKIIPETTTNAGTQGLLSHTMDFTGENYVGMFAAEKAVPNLNLRIVADNSQTSPGLYVMLVPKSSPLTSIAQLKGKKVGFPAPGFNFGSMAANILMKPYNESSKDFTTVVEPFSNAISALDFSLVATTYGIGERTLGALAIFGPSRMEYQKIIPLVHYLGATLSRALVGDRRDSRDSRRN